MNGSSGRGRGCSNGSFNSFYMFLHIGDSSSARAPTWFVDCRESCGRDRCVITRERTSSKVGQHTCRDRWIAKRRAKSGFGNRPRSIRDRSLREFTPRDRERKIGQGRAEGITLKSRQGKHPPLCRITGLLMDFRTRDDRRRAKRSHVNSADARGCMRERPNPQSSKLVSLRHEITRVPFSPSEE